MEDLKIGNLLLLKGITRHGKNRISQHGDVWKVFQIGKEKFMGEGDIKQGIVVESLNDTFNTGGSGKHKWVKDVRWLDFPEDENFEILKKI